MMGSASILKQYLGFDDDHPIGLSISHGVDFNHTVNAYDIESIEPIHWAYNKDIYKRSHKLKPSIKIPHPWLLLHDMHKGEASIKDGKTLIIAPPPSKANDNNLYKLISHLNPLDLEILVKHRGGDKKIDSSVEFWESKGIKTISAGPPDTAFYKNLYFILSQFENILACTMSSAVVFGVSIGCKCELITNYFAQGYETANYLTKTSFDKKSFNINSSKEIILSIKNKNFVLARELCKKILGIEFINNKSEIKDKLKDECEKLRHPFNTYGKNIIISRTRLILFNIFKKSSIISGSVYKNFINKFNAHVTYIEMNEIDVFKDGINDKNFIIKKIKYRKGVNDPGSA